MTLLPRISRMLLFAACTAAMTGCATRGPTQPTRPAALVPGGLEPREHRVEHAPAALATRAAARRWRGADELAQLGRAARRPSAPGGVHERLGELRAAAGLRQLAVTSLWRAALLCRDPVERARLSRRLARTASRDRHPRALRRAALDDLDRGDLQRAEQRLHSARRAAPAPALDYRLLWDLHLRRGDRTAAWAAQLLAREHAGAAPASLLTAQVDGAGERAAQPPR